VLLALALVPAVLLLYHEEDWGPFRVVDGDTVWGRAKYRALYIDAPEMEGAKGWHLEVVDNESCLRETAEKAAEAVEEELVYVRYQPWRRDPYGRVLGAFNGGQLEMELVERGLALCYHRQLGPFDRLDRWKVECLEREGEARRAGRGLWGCG